MVFVFGQVSETCLRRSAVFVRFVSCRERPVGPCPPAVFVLKSEIRGARAPPVDSFVPVLLYVQFWAVRTGGFTHTLMRNSLRLGGIQDAPRKPAEFVSGGRRTDGNSFVIAGELFVITVEVLCAITGQSYVCACLSPE